MRGPNLLHDFLPAGLLGQHVYDELQEGQLDYEGKALGGEQEVTQPAYDAAYE